MTRPLPSLHSTHRLVRQVLACAAALWLAAAPALGLAEDVPDASAAERLVFLNPHLAGMKAPATLRYQFVRTDAAEGGSFKDSVELKLARGKATACCKVSGSFLSGERAMRLPDVDDARSNPVLMYFLEYEVRQLQRSTKGGAAHFRQQIRLALVDKADLSPTRIEWGGREVAATTVQISPFLDDPYRARFEREARKVYSFVMSDEVPGGVYQIRTRLPDATSGTTAVEESLTLVAR
jgi:hypothetical protein